MDVYRVARHRRPTRVPQRSATGRHSGAVVEVLHAERHAGERTRILAGGDQRVDSLCVATSLVGIEVDEGVELVVAAIDRRQALVECLNGGEVSSSHLVCCVDDRAHGASVAMVSCVD